MFTIDDYIDALKKICQTQPNVISDSIYFEDKTIKISCQQNGELYVETYIKSKTECGPMKYDTLKNILIEENNLLKNKSLEENPAIRQLMLAIFRERKINEILNSPDLPFPEEQ